MPSSSKMTLNQADHLVHLSNASRLPVKSKEKLPKNVKLGLIMYSRTFEWSQINYSIRSGEKMKHSNLKLETLFIHQKRKK